MGISSTFQKPTVRIPGKFKIAKDSWLKSLDPGARNTTSAEETTAIKNKEQTFEYNRSLKAY